MTLEEEFAKVVEANKAEISRLIAEAHASLKAACDLSEATGVPFYSYVSHLSQGYVPESFRTVFKGVDLDAVADITDVYLDEYSCGWEHSAVCY